VCQPTPDDLRGKIMTDQQKNRSDTHMAVIIYRNGVIERHLQKLYRTEHGIQSVEEIINEMPDPPRKEIFDGTCRYNRRHFNRLDHKGQDAYMAKLEAQRFYALDGMTVPKSVFDAVKGDLTRSYAKTDS
jgi:hypothetical protein